MKRNLLTVLFLICAGNTYASTIEGGKLLNHYESIAPNSKLSFKTSKVDLEKIKILKIGIETAKSTQGTSFDIMSSLGRIDVSSGFVSVDGNDNNFLFIYNDTSDYKFYKILRRICVIPSGQISGGCSYSRDSISVNPNYAFNDKTIPTLLTSVSTPGEYTVSFETAIVDVDKNDNQETLLLNSFDYRTITIPDSANKKIARDLLK
jgi:hypothetical protein